MAEVRIEFEFDVDIDSSASAFSARRDDTTPGERELRQILDRFEYNLLVLFPEATSVQASARVRLDSLHGDAGAAILEFPDLDFLISQQLVYKSLQRVCDALAEAIVMVFSKDEWKQANIRVGKPYPRPSHISPHAWDQFWLKTYRYTPSTAAAISQHMYADYFKVRAKSAPSGRFQKLSTPEQRAVALWISNLLMFGFICLVWWITQNGQNKRHQELLRAITASKSDTSAPVVETRVEISTPSQQSLEQEIGNLPKQDEQSNPCQEPSKVRVYAGGKKLSC